MKENEKLNQTKSNESPNTYGEISTHAANIPGNSIDEHRKVETGNIILTGEEIRQQNENL